MKATPLLHVSVSRGDDIATVAVAGELDCATAPRLEAALREACTGRRPPKRIVVDVHGITFVDIAGLNPLIQVARDLGGPGALQLRNAGHALARVIRLLDLAEILGLDS